MEFVVERVLEYLDLMTARFNELEQRLESLERILIVPPEQSPRQDLPMPVIENNSLVDIAAPSELIAGVAPVLDAIINDAVSDSNVDVAAISTSAISTASSIEYDLKGLMPEGISMVQLISCIVIMADLFEKPFAFNIGLHYIIAIAILCYAYFWQKDFKINIKDMISLDLIGLLSPAWIRI